MPVWSGSVTGWRCTTPGALNSSGRIVVVRMGPWAVERISERVDDAPDELVPHRDADDLPVRLTGSPSVTCSQSPREGSRRCPLRVEGDPGDAVLELEHLHGHAVLESVDAREAVPDLQHRPDVGQVRLDVVVLDPLLQDRGDLLQGESSRFCSLFHPGAKGLSSLSSQGRG
jgi:hypothetical protein